ncbi:MAG: PAS domain S-box protein, partial [Cytophagaceae bacterium]
TKDWSQTPIGLPEQWPPPLRTILNMMLHAQAPMFLWWGPELIQFYNDAYRPSLGTTGKHPTALGQRGQDCWPESWHAIKPMIDQVLAGESVGAEDQLIPIHRNGQLENVYWTFGYSPIRNETGQVAGVLVICQETTQKVIMAREEQARFRFAIEAAQFGIWEVDPVTNLVHWDNRSAGLFGLTSNQDIPYVAAIRHIHPDDVGLVNQTVRQEMSSRSNGQYDLTYRTIGAEDGRLRWVRFKGRSVFSPEGKLERFSGIAYEVTKEVLARQAVEANATYLQRVFRSAAVGMAIFEGPSFVIEVANPSVCAIWGRTEAQVMGKSLFEALPEAAGQGFEELLMNVMATRQPFVGKELPAIINRNGQFITVYFDFVYEPLPDADGRVSRILVTASDATERRRTRQQIEVSEANLRTLFA